MTGTTTAASAITSATVAAASSAGAAPSPLTKDERKQLERTRESLAFLDRIERIRVTGTVFYDMYERVTFDVVMKNSKELSARKTQKNAKKHQPVVDYSSKKSLVTLKNVHQAVHEWSAKHPEPTALDGTSPCAYCQQFNSPAALELWKWSAALTQQPPQSTNDSAALSVVVNTSALQKYEQCLNSYLECARAVPEGALERACPGVAHIPAIVARFIANEPTRNSAVAYSAVFCKIM